MLRARSIPPRLPLVSIVICASHNTEPSTAKCWIDGTKSSAHPLIPQTVSISSHATRDPYRSAGSFPKISTPASCRGLNAVADGDLGVLRGTIGKGAQIKNILPRRRVRANIESNGSSRRRVEIGMMVECSSGSLPLLLALRSYARGRRQMIDCAVSGHCNRLYIFNTGVVELLCCRDEIFLLRNLLRHSSGSR
jgi:hypothetical protein